MLVMRSGKAIDDMGEEWLTTQEAMAALGISRTRLWQLTKEGLLTAHQRGANRKARYYRRTEVERVQTQSRPVTDTKTVRQQEG